MINYYIRKLFSERRLTVYLVYSMPVSHKPKPDLGHLMPGANKNEAPLHKYS